MSKATKRIQTGNIILQIETDELTDMHTVAISVYICGKKVDTLFVDYLKDTLNGAEQDEWLIQRKSKYQEDPVIINQGNI